MTADGPRLIDWFATVRAPAAVDLGVCHIVLSELVREPVDDPGRPHAYCAAMQPEYARLAGTSPVTLTAAMEPVRVYVLLWGAFSCPAGAADPARRSDPALAGRSAPSTIAGRRGT